MTTALWCKDRYYNLLLLSKNNNNKLNDVEELELLSYQVKKEAKAYIKKIRPGTLSFRTSSSRERRVHRRRSPVRAHHSSGGPPR